MIVIKFWIETLFSNSVYEETIEVLDGSTDEEIDEIVKDSVFETIGWGWDKE
jgi:hypothetical protein